MKKVILMMAFVAILTTNGKAQTAPLADNREAMSFGLKAGVNYSIRAVKPQNRLLW